MDKRPLPPNDHRTPHGEPIPPHGVPIPPHGVPPYGTYDMYAPHKHFHGKPDNHTAHFTPHLLHYHIPESFKFWCNKVIPLVYDDSLSYMELLNKVVMYLNGMLEDEKLVAVNMEELARAYHELEHFVNDYFAFYQSKGIINHDIAVTNNNYLEILPDCDTAQMNTAYRLKFAEGSEQNIPANLPTGAIPFSGAECVLLNLSNFVLKRMGGEWQEVPPNGKQAVLTNNYQMLITDKDIFFREHNGDEWQDWQSIFGNWWAIEWEKVKEYVDNGDETVTRNMTELINTVKSILEKALNDEIKRATNRENEIASDLQFEVERAQDAEATISANLAEEIARAKKAEADEKARAEKAEKVLDDKIEAENNRAVARENEIESKLNDEILRATTAEGKIRTDLNAETTRATTAENGLKSDITAETSRATNAETQLRKDITDETARATTAENALKSDITAETTRATGAENSLSARIQDWETNLAEEITNRIRGDETNANAISAEVTRAKNAEGALSTRVTNAETNISNLQTNVSNLNTWKGETDTRIQGIWDKNSQQDSAISAIQSEQVEQNTKLAEDRKAIGDLETNMSNATTAIHNVEDRTSALETANAQQDRKIQDIVDGYIPNGGNSQEMSLKIEREDITLSTTDGGIFLESEDGGELYVTGSVHMKSTDGAEVSVGEFANLTGHNGGNVEVSDEVNIRGLGGGSIRVSDLVKLADDEGSSIDIDNYIHVVSQDDLTVEVEDKISVTANAGNVLIEATSANATLKGQSATVRSDNGNLTLMQASNAPLSLVVGSQANSKAYYQKGGQHTPTASEEIATIGDITNAVGDGFIPNAGNNKDVAMTITRKNNKFVSTASTNGFVVEGGNVDIKANNSNNRTMNIESTGTMTVHSTIGTASFEGSEGVTVECVNGNAELNAIDGSVAINGGSNVNVFAVDTITIKNKVDNKIIVDNDGVDLLNSSGVIVDVGFGDTDRLLLANGANNYITLGEAPYDNKINSIYIHSANNICFNTKWGITQAHLILSLTQELCFGTDSNVSHLNGIPNLNYHITGILSENLNVPDGSYLNCSQFEEIRCETTNEHYTISSSSDVSGVLYTSLYRSLTLRNIEVNGGTDSSIFTGRYGANGSIYAHNCILSAGKMFDLPSGSGGFGDNLELDGCIITGDINIIDPPHAIITIKNCYINGSIIVGSGGNGRIIVSNCVVTGGITGSGANSVKKINVLNS